MIHTVLDLSPISCSDDHAHWAQVPEQMILWIFWIGLRREVEDIPIVDHIMRGVTDDDAVRRARALQDTREIFLKVLVKPVDDAQAHLRRIMADASAGTSKYNLLRSARAKLDFKGTSTAPLLPEFGPPSAEGEHDPHSGMVNSSATDRDLFRSSSLSVEGASLVIDS
ncbi:hypothetical protein EDD16DRAFT_1899397 [Pisolithus croceorrhizus]|nr:hypothetical protein EDD16DRAFT_1899397 [Pisolithus croceorrhizus]